VRAPLCALLLECASPSPSPLPVPPRTAPHLAPRHLITIPHPSWERRESFSYFENKRVRPMHFSISAAYLHASPANITKSFCIFPHLEVPPLPRPFPRRHTQAADYIAATILSNSSIICIPLNIHLAVIGLKYIRMKTCANTENHRIFIITMKRPSTSSESIIGQNINIYYRGTTG
jgi:hypothetical protein